MLLFEPTLIAATGGGVGSVCAGMVGPCMRLVCACVMGQYVRCGVGCWVTS